MMSMRVESLRNDDGRKAMKTSRVAFCAAIGKKSAYLALLSRGLETKSEIVGRLRQSGSSSCWTAITISRLAPTPQPADCNVNGWHRLLNSTHNLQTCGHPTNCQVSTEKIYESLGGIRGNQKVMNRCSAIIFSQIETNWTLHSSTAKSSDTRLSWTQNSPQ